MDSRAKPKLMTQVRDLMRFKHMALATERAYLHWIKRYIYYHNKVHPLDLPPEAIGIYLTHLAKERGVAPTTQNQALNALVFLYREVLQKDLGDLTGILNIGGGLLFLRD